MTHPLPRWYKTLIRPAHFWLWRRLVLDVAPASRQDTSYRWRVGNWLVERTVPAWDEDEL